MKKFLKNNLFLILTILLSLPAAFALFHKGFYGASDDLHVAWLYEMNRLFKSWQFPPRFVPDLSFGFGYPLFNFVFPLPFYIGEIFHLLGLNFVDSVKTVFGISFIASGVTMFLFLSEIISPALGLAGALIYVYTPYRSTDIYVRGAFGEAFSFIFLPLALYAIIRIYKSASRKDIGVLSFSLAALILSHDIVSYMFFPFLLLFVVMLYFISPNKKTFILKSAIGIILGLIVSLYFWFPAVKDSSLMIYGTVFNYLDHFPTLLQLITPYFGYGASVPGPYDGMSFYIGTLNWVLVILGTVIAIFNWKKIDKLKKSILIWALITFVIAFFMMNFRSSFLWSHLPYLPYFQFPWRFLSVSVFAAAVLGGISIDRIASLHLNDKSNTNISLFIVYCLLLILTTIGMWHPKSYLMKSESFYKDTYLSTTDTGESSPVWSVRFMEHTPAGPAGVISGSALITQTFRNTTVHEYRVAAERPSRLVENTLYFPGWKIYIDGTETEIQFQDPEYRGLMTFRIPEGNHLVRVAFGDTRLRSVSNAVSLISVGMLAVSGLGTILWKKRR